MNRFDAGRSYIEESIRRKESAAEADALEAARLVSTHNFSEHAYAALVRRISKVKTTVGAERDILARIDEAEKEAARRARVDEPKQAAAFAAQAEEKRIRELSARALLALSSVRERVERWGQFDQYDDDDHVKNVATLRAALDEPKVELSLRIPIERVLEQLNTRKKAS